MSTYLSLNIIKIKIIKIKLTSYDNICDTERIEPIIEYAELADQPIHTTIYLITDIKIIINNNE